MLKHIKLFEEFYNGLKNGEVYQSWEEATYEATREFEHKHPGGLKHVVSLIEAGDDESMYEDELFGEATMAVADPSAYLSVDLTREAHADLEKSSNTDGTWVHRCKQAIENLPSAELWYKVIDYIEENGF